MKIKYKTIFLSILFMLVGFSAMVYGQELPPPGQAPPPGVPIDGGVLFGVFFALFYGVKKLLKHHK